MVQSLRKFKGSDIDEDDAEEREQVRRPRSGDGKGNPYFLRPIQQHAAELVAMAKANGEAAHMSALWMVVSQLQVMHLGYFSFSISPIHPVLKFP